LYIRKIKIISFKKLYIIFSLFFQREKSRMKRDKEKKRGVSSWLM